MKRFLSILKKIILIKFKYLPPPKKEVIIFDSHSTERIKIFFAKSSYIELNTRGEEVNLFIFFNCLINFELSYQKYLKRFIDYVNPKILITLIDNNIFFYRIKLKRGKKIFIQVSRRSSVHDDVFYELKKLKKEEKKDFNVDHMFVHNKFIGQEYKKYIKGNIHLLGSLQSNFKKKVKKNIYIKVLYVSTYRNFMYSSHFKKSQEKKKYDLKYIKNEIKLLHILNKFCVDNKIKIHILGAQIENSKEEKNFYYEIFSKNMIFIERTIKRKTYQIVDRSDTVVGIDSTLIYEALGRGSKVGIFAVRDIPSRNFAWPKHYKTKGFFWVNKFSESNIKKIIKFLLFKCSYTRWNKLTKTYQKSIMPYNNSNKLLIDCLKNTKN